MVAKDTSILPTGEYFVNVYKDGSVGEAHLSRAVAQLHGIGHTNKRIRLVVTNLGDVLELFNVDEAR